jgi:(1->4)-alpha-D-glucan 1-alpha-D-glucosylmutase
VPSDWPIDGTTGYEFANEVNGIFVDRLNGRAFDELYRRFTGDRTPFAEIAHRHKSLIMQVGMASEINVLAHRLNRLSEANRHYRDFTLNSLAHAIREIIACFPVYRTYVSAGDVPVSDRDRMYIDRAVNQAKRRNPALPGLAFDFIRDLLLKRADYISGRRLQEYLRFVTQFQQTTSPVTAKGIEDTALYVYPRLVSLNEVGGEPSRFGVPPAHLHDWLARRQHDWPAALSATSTHDTKRSEDVRARINVLSEIPGAWKVALARWARLNRKLRTSVDGQIAPDRNEEYLLYQTLLGAWPGHSPDAGPGGEFVDRIGAYMVKALREAKRNSSWLNPRRAYEEAVTTFVRQALDPASSAAFLSDLETLAERVAHAAVWNGLAQTVIKVTAPGVPDFYQGTEIWDLSLVDPDNRRRVDYGKRRAMLDAIAPSNSDAALSADRLAELVANRLDGRIKLYTVVRALRTRQADPELFQQGAYLPLTVTGARSMHVFAFARVHASAAVVTIVPRLTTTLVAEPAVPPLGAVWADTRVQIPPIFEPTPMTDAFTGQRVIVSADTRELPLAEVFRHFPVAVLTNG